ncbi:DUF317 domain-containing protein [Streptomyces sp. NPDC096176]|uniref:DUF317 domain-containing protein n=1 Tax=Streptomyces sp. NPDC096176 TaxID=3366079 RepID=UPI0037F983C7
MAFSLRVCRAVVDDEVGASEARHLQQTLATWTVWAGPSPDRPTWTLTASPHTPSSLLAALSSSRSPRTALPSRP